LPPIKNQRYDTNLGLELTVSSWRANCPFTTTVILLHAGYAVQTRLATVCYELTLFDLSTVNYMDFWFVLFSAVCHCSIKGVLQRTFFYFN